MVFLIVIAFAVFTEKTSLAKEGKNKNLKIRQALPPDAIPSIKNPEFVPASKAKIHPEEPVIGLSINGHNRAYSVFLLNSHEIVNDVIGGKPVAVTW